MDENQVLNPFGFGEVSRVIDENRKPFARLVLVRLDLNQVFVENEFYVLFSDGLLVKKGRSKFRTSQYIKGEKFTSFNQVYARV
jgi:hypothetical protein